jgi:hypothetical protein
LTPFSTGNAFSDKLLKLLGRIANTKQLLDTRMHLLIETKNFYLMKSIKPILVFLMFLVLSGCEKTQENSAKGKLLFYTNSPSINCVFKIDILVNGEKIGTLDASSKYTDSDCNCDNPTGIGLLVNLGKGTYNYSANEINCIATNKVNSWTGQVNVEQNSCTVIFLDITKK